MIDIYRAGFQGVKVRAFMLVALAVALGGCWWGWDLFQTYGTLPGDGGVLAPLGQRIAWGLTVASLGIGFAVAMWAYGRRYVARIRYDRKDEALAIETIGFLVPTTKRYPAASVSNAAFESGVSMAPRVNAPWYWLTIKGRRARLILDAQGQFVDPDLAERLLKLRLPRLA